MQQALSTGDNACYQETNGLRFSSYWLSMRKWREWFTQLQGEVMQNHCKSTFHAKLKSALLTAGKSSLL